MSDAFQNFLSGLSKPSTNRWLPEIFLRQIANFKFREVPHEEMLDGIRLTGIGRVGQNISLDLNRLPPGAVEGAIELYTQFFREAYIAAEFKFIEFCKAHEKSSIVLNEEATARVMAEMQSYVTKAFRQEGAYADWMVPYRKDAPTGKERLVKVFMRFCVVYKEAAPELWTSLVEVVAEGYQMDPNNPGQYVRGTILEKYLS